MSNKISVWRLMLFHQPEKYDQMLQWVRKTNRVAIGWGDIGDMHTQHFRSNLEICASIRKTYPEARNSGDGGSSLWKFYSEIKCGDIIVLKSRRAKELVVRVHAEHGSYRFDEVNAFGDYFHQRCVEITTISPERLWGAAGQICEGYSKRHTLFKFTNLFSEAELRAM